MLMYLVILEINCNNRVFLGHDGISSLKILLFGNGWKVKKKKKAICEHINFELTKFEGFYWSTKWVEFCVMSTL